MIILASQSPRRAALLRMLGVPFEAEPADVDETPGTGEEPKALAIRLARLKADVVAARRPGRLVLAADTVVALGDEQLGKPESPADAERILARLSGRMHRVITAIALVRDTRAWTAVDVTEVTFRALDGPTIRDYVATGEPLDKAGAYGLQGYGGVLIERIAGDCFGVVGLPIRLVVDLLAEAGAPYRFTR